MKSIYFVIGIFISVIAIAFCYLSFNKPTDSLVQHVDELATKKNRDYQKYFEENINFFYKLEGINGLIDRVVLALSTGQIDMYACHSLAHDIGHYAGYPEYFEDIELYTNKRNLDFCGSGFSHGVEGQLANNEYPQNIEDLYNFCKLAMVQEPYYNGCYHGAGHSFMENTKNPAEAMEQCDMLKFDEKIQADECYRGVFSENVNFIIGNGGEYETLLTYCNSLTDTKQNLCAQELHGLGLSEEVTEEDIQTALSLCIKSEYSLSLQEGCVKSVATVVTDRLVANTDSVVAPSSIMLLNLDLFDRYINTSMGTFSKTAKINPNKKISNFCISITDPVRATRCLEQVRSTEASLAL